MTAINIIRPRNERSADAYSSPNQLRAPGMRMYWLMHQVIGSDTSKTNVTATPSPNAVFTFFETARYEHIPRKYAKIILSMNIDRMKRFKFSIITLANLCFYFCEPKLCIPLQSKPLVEVSSIHCWNNRLRTMTVV